jgi:hypothetical protein
MSIAGKSYAEIERGLKQIQEAVNRLDGPKAENVREEVGEIVQRLLT